MKICNQDICKNLQKMYEKSANLVILCFINQKSEEKAVPNRRYISKVSMVPHIVNKGQLISEWVFGDFNFPKNQRKKY